MRTLTWLRCDASDNAFAHPVAGLVADVDVIERQVVRLIDTGAVPVPAECARYEAEFNGPARTDLRPLEITQPEGPSFELTGNVLTWQNWRFRIDFNGREGLVLHQISHRDGDRDRPVLHRASLGEMAVSYADPGADRNWVAFLDAGEYALGRNANALKLGCDCLGEIRYLDAVLSDDFGRPETLPNAICIHEEDFGLLWKHTNQFDGMKAESRRARRLVVSYIATVGNYDYGFYWYFHQDGTIAFEAKSTGLVQTSAIPAGQGSAYGTELAPGLLGPYHQHMFCVRLDVAVDGLTNTVEEVDVVPVPALPGQPQRQRLHRTGHPDHRQRGGRTPRRPRHRAPLADHQSRLAQPDGGAGGVHPRPAARTADPGPAGLGGGPPPRVRQQALLGHPAQPRAPLPGGRLPQPAPGRGRAAGVDGGRGVAGGHRADGVAHLRPDPCAQAGGMARDAGRPQRFHPQADRLLRPQPGPGPARRNTPGRTLLHLK